MDLDILKILQNKKIPSLQLLLALKNKSKGRINERSHAHKGMNDVREVQLSHE